MTTRADNQRGGSRGLFGGLFGQASQAGQLGAVGPAGQRSTTYTSDPWTIPAAVGGTAAFGPVGGAVGGFLGNLFGSSTSRPYDPLASPETQALQRDFDDPAGAAREIERQQRELYGDVLGNLIPSGRPLERRDVSTLQVRDQAETRDRAYGERDQAIQRLEAIASSVGQGETATLARELAAAGIQTGGLGDLDSAREAIRARAASGREAAIRQGQSSAAAGGTGFSAFERAQLERDSRSQLAGQLGDFDLQREGLAQPYRQQALSLLSQMGLTEDSARSEYLAEAARALLGTEYQTLDYSPFLLDSPAGFVGR